jgi:hypothetical protein
MSLFKKVCISACILIVFGFGWFALGSLFWTPQTQEQQWVREMDERCQAAHGRGTYVKTVLDGQTVRVYECWQKPAFRRPKLVFKVPYIGSL